MLTFHAVAKARSPFRALDIQNLLNIVDRSVSQVEVCANNLRDELIVKTHSKAEAIDETTVRIEEGMATIGQHMDGHFNVADARMAELLQEQQFMFRQVSDALCSQNGMFNMLKDAVLSKSSSHSPEADSGTNHA